jgi:L-cysteine:1D-myo-inositol 2-amino-2-deoxy-alpha-D-glucopyranoside ligase
LGEQIDIHGGGADLAFPHHTCEIAQSEHVTGKAPFSRFWMHTGMVYQDGEKMSKSLGNLTLVGDLLKEYSADAIRLLLQSHHYRYQWECFLEDLRIAADTAVNLKRVREMVGQGQGGEDSMLRNLFHAAMDNDLNTTEAVLLLRRAAKDALNDRNMDTGAEAVRLAYILGLTLS